MDEDIKPISDVSENIAPKLEETTDNEEVEKVRPGPGLFSSENFKIEVNNLPKFCGHAQLKKLFGQKMKLNYHKLKPCGPKANYMFICFKNDEDKEKALMVINGFTFKGSKLQAKSASKQKDPLQKKSEQIVKTEVVDDRPVSERLQDAVCPLWKDSYEDQLGKKQSEVLVLVKRLGSEVSRTHDVLKQWVQSKCKEYETLAPVQNFVRSPSVTGYRNKCEFTIGHMSPSETEKVVSVGFRLSSYKNGSVEVVSLSSLPDIATTLPHIPGQMVNIAIKLEQYIRGSGVSPYCSVERKGNWRNVMMRCSRGRDWSPDDSHTGSYSDTIKEMMVVVCCDPMNLDQETITRLKSELKQIFSTDGKVTSLYLQMSPARKEAGQHEPAPELLFGPPCIQENLLGRKFSISPQAFFQVNTLAAEVLYKLAGDIADLNERSTLVDVCCGTGTIGLCLADKVKNVVGVDIVADAIRDAQKNAELNGFCNCNYFTGKAEDILANILRDIDNKDIVAIVDPPRAGLHQKALKAIRNTLAIRRLVYISCDAKNAMKNFVDLARAPSGSNKGDPFLPVKIIPVDLFPHTRGFELVILFERVAWGEILNTEIAKRIRDEETQNLDDMASIADDLQKKRESMDIVE